MAAHWGSITDQMLAQTIAPPWLVILLGAPAMLLIAGHLLWLWSRRSATPASRVRIRVVNGAVMLVLCPMLAFGFGFLDPRDPAQQRAFTLCWLFAIGLLGIVVMLTAIDAFNNARLATQSRRKLNEELALIRADIAKARADAARLKDSGADG